MQFKRTPLDRFWRHVDPCRTDGCALWIGSRDTTGHLQSYADEYSFRYNHRDDSQAMFTTVGQRVKAVRAGQYGEYSPLG